MAINTSTTSPANGTEAVFTLLTMLLAAGWTVPAWSDGTTLTTPGAALTANPYGSAASGAGNLGNTSAWFRVTAPSSSREWIFQRGAADTTWTVARSRLGYTGGAPNATTLPTDATSSQTLSAAAVLFSATPGVWLISVDTVDYGWTAFTVPVGGGNVATLVFDEPLLTGTYPTTPVADDDPVLFGLYYNGTGLVAAGGWNVQYNSSLPVYKRVRHGLSSPSNVRVGYARVHINNNSVTPAVAGAWTTLGTDPYNSYEVPLSIQVGATAVAINGWVGVTSHHRWCTVAGRSNGQTLVAGSDYWIYCAGVWVPWDSSTPAI